MEKAQDSFLFPDGFHYKFCPKHQISKRKQTKTISNALHSEIKSQVKEHSHYTTPIKIKNRAKHQNQNHIKKCHREN